MNIDDEIEQKKKIVYAQYKDEDWQKMLPPKPGDWLYSFREEGQSFKEYKKFARNKKTSKRNTIYLQPIGENDEMFEQTIRKMKEYAEIFFDCKVKVLKPIPLPRQAYNKRRAQYDASVILDILRDKVPDDTLAYAGIMMEDLYVRELNFVFGLGSFTNPVGVYSLVRYQYGTSEKNTFLKRSLKVMNHELGHIFSMQHCIFYKCIMNGSNSLLESDSRPIHLCPLCHDKLQWNMGFDEIERYKELIEFYRKEKFEDEARFLEKRLQKIQGKTRKK